MWIVTPIPNESSVYGWRDQLHQCPWIEPVFRNSMLEILIFALIISRPAGKEEERMDPITMLLVTNIRLALEEDINGEDVITCSIIPDHQKGEAQLLCKEDGIIASLPICECVFTNAQSSDICRVFCKSSEPTERSAHGSVEGDVHVLVSGERTALNYPKGS